MSTPREEPGEIARRIVSSIRDACAVHDCIATHGGGINWVGAQRDFTTALMEERERAEQERLASVDRVHTQLTGEMDRLLAGVQMERDAALTREAEARAESARLRVALERTNEAMIVLRAWVYHPDALVENVRPIRHEAVQESAKAQEQAQAALSSTPLAAETVRAVQDAMKWLCCWRGERPVHPRVNEQERRPCDCQACTTWRAPALRGFVKEGE